MNLEIECKGIADISFHSGYGNVELQEVDMSFLEDISADDIILYCDNQKLLEAIEADEIAEFYESKFDVTVIDHSRDID